jgi:predicted dehydrogenase
VLRIKIIGAGSIGNHHAHAARALGWSVVVCDTDAAALRRMRESIYPSRYARWDPDIVLTPCSEAPRGDFDLIVIGTPPDTHVRLALQALAEGPAAVLIEKPLAEPSLAGVEELQDRAGSSRTRVFVGYDHVVGKAAQMVVELLQSQELGDVETIDVEFREHWVGIFAAHSWLSGPEDTYLGFWERGGGAAAEHSHATNLWQRFALAAGAGRVTEVQATLDYATTGTARYDRLCLLNLRTEGGLAGRVVQDVVTLPARKWARVQATGGAIEWAIGHRPGEDAVTIRRPGRADDVTPVKKTRPDDFIQELAHVASCVSGGAPSPLDLVHGVDTMRVIQAAHQSQATGQRISVTLGSPGEALVRP